MSDRLGRWFTVRERGNGEPFTLLAEDAPEWLYDACRDAHDGEFPNDWRWEMCRAIVGAFDDGVDDDLQLADDLVPVYTGERLAWLADDVSRVAYCDDAVAEFGLSADAEMADRIGAGMFLALSGMVGVLSDAIRENADVVTL